MVALRLENVTFAYGSQTVLHDICATIDAPVTAIVGPNAVGKTTLLKCIAGVIKPRGRVLLDGRDMATLNHDERAQRVGYLAQEMATDSTLTVLEYVLLGRLNHLVWSVGDDDLAAAMAIMEDLNISDITAQPISQLSGGQCRIVSIAQVLVQHPILLLMDEPTSNLDLQRQLEMLEVVRRLAGSGSLRAILTLHDLNLAARFADEIIILDGGRRYSAGTPADTLTAPMLRAVYSVEADVVLDQAGIPSITPLRSVGANMGATRATVRQSGKGDVIPLFRA